MAPDTPKNHRNLVIYELFVRNHGRNGNFADVSADLPRLKEMGVDVVWLMPIHPIGEAERKGPDGSPYAIRNYREVNPEYGTKEQFRLLCQYAHALGLKVMIDVVYNHTSPDADLTRVHPQWYQRDENGRFHATVPDWSDIIDLDYSSDPALWDYQIETLKQWALLGVDGFRCDVASAVPVAFWEQARREVAAVKPGVIWLAETVHLGFIHFRRRLGLVAHADAEIEAATAQPVQGREFLGGVDRIALWHQGDAGAESDPVGGGGDEAEGGHGIEQATTGWHRHLAILAARIGELHLVEQHHVLTHPQRLQPGLLGASGEVRDHGGRRIG